MKTGTDKPTRSAAELLNTPIEYSADFLTAGAHRLKDEACREAVQEVARQWHERYDALFEYFGVPRAEPNAQSRLILLMGMKLFPQAFQYIRAGEKTRGNKKRWTTREQLELLELMRLLRSAGMTVEAAAELIEEHSLWKKPVPKAQSIVARYYEAEQLIARLHEGKVSLFEQLDMAAFHKDVEDPQDRN